LRFASLAHYLMARPEPRAIGESREPLPSDCEDRRLASKFKMSSNVRNAPLATVGPKKAACRDGPEADITKIKRKRKQQNWLLNWIATAHGTQQGLALLAILRQPKPSTAPAISPLATINF
jgi:hypothetical protein